MVEMGLNKQVSTFVCSVKQEFVVARSSLNINSRQRRSPDTLPSPGAVDLYVNCEPCTKSFRFQGCSVNALYILTQVPI